MTRHPRTPASRRPGRLPAVIRLAPFALPAVALAVVSLAMIVGLGAPARAVLPEPDHTLYGTPRVDGAVATEGVVSLAIGGATLATYTLGSNPQLGTCDAADCLFALRVPMDFGGPGDPQPAGMARPGDEAELFVDGVLAGEAVIGEPGEAQPLDIDTSFVPLVPSLSVVDAAGAEALAGPFGLDVDVTLKLSFPSDDPVTVDWRTQDGTASAGSDYMVDAGQAFFAAGETTATITVTLHDDALPEADPALQVRGESFFVVLSDPVEAVLLDAVGTVTIVDDDTPPALAIANLSVVEPPSGAVEAAFMVHLSAPWTEDVSFAYSARPGTADSADFELTAGTATISAGSVATEIAVRILADSEVEADETFEVRLSDPVAASIRPGGGQGTILAAPRLLTFVERQRDGEAGADGLFGAIDVALSPGGEHLYATGRGDDALAVFGRETGTGRLGFVAAYRNDAEGLAGLAGMEAVAVSPDGQRVYVVATDDDALAVFDRDSATGALTLAEVERDGRRDAQSGATVDGLRGAIALVAIPNPFGGDHLYVAGSEGDTLAIFRYEPAGGLMHFEQVLRDGENGVDGLGRAVAVAHSPSGQEIYVASLDDDSVAVFDRDPFTGLLAFVELHRDGTGGVDGLAGAAAVAVSPDGLHVYVAGQDDGGLAVFDRAPDGTLTFRQAVLNGVGGIAGLALATDVAVSRDGLYVYATGFAEDALTVFARAADGTLTPVEIERDGASGIDGLDGAAALVVSDDDAQVYAAGNLDDAVAVFRRDLVAPTAPVAFESTSHAAGTISTAPVIDFAWSGATDDDTGSGVAGYRLLVDDAPDTVPSAGDGLFLPHGLDAHVASSDPQPDGERWAHLLTCDHAGNCTVTHAGPFGVDTTPPTVPALISPSHQPGVWSDDPAILVEWAGSTDSNGVAGYSFLFDGVAGTVPDAIVDLAHGADPHAVTSAPLDDGDGYFFHLRSCDVPTNCGEAVHLGPFRIDTASPSPVTGLVSTSHPLDDTSTVQEIDIAWNAVTDALSGVADYAVEFSPEATWVCDRVPDIGATTTEATSPTLDDGDWYAHVCAGDEAGNWTEAATAGPFAISTAPAIVISVATVADTGDGQLTAGEATEIPITQLYLDFSRPMNDPAGDDDPVDVTNPASYQLISDGGDGQVDSSDCAAVDPSDSAISIDQVDYVSIPRRAVLRIHGGVPLPAGNYRLIGCAQGLADEVDTPLDGNADGAAGDDFRLDFAVLASDRLRNPNFDQGLEDWMLIAPDGEAVEHDALDADGLGTSGSARITRFGGGPDEPFALAQCLPVDPADNLEVRARVRIDSPGAIAPLVSARAELFAFPNCAGSPIEQVTTTLSTDTDGAWPSLDTDVSVPAAAFTALVSFTVIPQGSVDFEVHLDVLYFGDQVFLFADGFEDGDTSAWSGSNP